MDFLGLADLAGNAELFNLVDRLTDIGLDKKLFGLHSLRSGGATAAASNASVCDRLIMKHGRWVTEKSKKSW